MMVEREMLTSIRQGISFGLASGVITTLGLLIGLYSGTHSVKIVITGILVIAIADALSDSLGMHLSVESEKKSIKSVWFASIATFFTKLIVALSFIIPILLFSLQTAVIVSIIWGLFLITLFSIYLAKQGSVPACQAVFEHIAIAIVVIILAQLVGYLVSLIGI